MTTETKYQPRRMQPLVAMRALKQLIADPERTEKVFEIIQAMSGNALHDTYQRFRQSESGGRILKEKPHLLKVLQDRDALRRMEPGTLGRAYLNFVEREQITADGLVEASGREDEIQDRDMRLFAERQRDQHDLWHVLTGYGRDTFGEACLLSFTYAQTKNRGLGLIALIGAFKIASELGNDVYKASWRAYRAGRRASWLPQQEWEILLTKPIDEVRQQLGITPPEVYLEVLSNYQPADRKSVV